MIPSAIRIRLDPSDIDGSRTVATGEAIFDLGRLDKAVLREDAM